MSALPLSGVRVLDLSDGLGAYCGRLLADHGADVVKVEPLGGGDLRRRPPFLHGESGPDSGLPFAYYDANKRGIVLDVTADEATLRSLAAEADVIVITPSAARPGGGVGPGRADIVVGAGVGDRLLHHAVRVDRAAA